MQHARPRLNLFARQLLVERVQAGWTPTTAAEALGVSRATTYKWLRRVGMLAQWLHLYNYHRAHTALGGVAPIQRVNNLYGNYN